MAHVERRNKGWRVRWRERDGAERSRKCPDKRSAEQLKRLIEAEQALGRDWQPDAGAPARGPALADVAEAYLRAHAQAWSKSTLRVRTMQLDVWLSFCGDAGAAATTADLSGQHLHGYLEWLLLPGTGRHGTEPRQRSTARRYLGLVELVWAWAHEWQDDHEGWAGHVPRPRRVSRSVRVDPPGWRVAPTWADMRAAIRAANGWVRELFTAMYYTGLRVDQVLRLRRDDVDLVEATLVVRGELGKTDQERAGRLVPLAPSAVSWMSGLPTVEGGWLLPCDRADRQARSWVSAAAWQRSGVRAEKWEGRPNHAFRAGWMSSLRRSGADLDAIEVLVGHAPTPTARNYFDTDAWPLRDVVARIPPHTEDP